MVIGDVLIKSGNNLIFYNYGKFVDENLNIIPQNQLVEISQTSGSKIRIGFLSSDILRRSFNYLFFKNNSFKL